MSKSICCKVDTRIGYYYSDSDSDSDSTVISAK